MKTVKIKTVKRDTVLYARVKKQNVAFVKAEAKKNGVSVSNYMDQVVDSIRK